MFTRQLRFAAVIALALAAAPAVPAQETKETPQDNYVTHASFKNRVMEVRHRDPEALVSVLKLLTSGHKGASISADRTFRTITVRDFPENIASVEDALKRLDTAEGARPEVELRMHVLIASNADGAGGQLPADLKEVVGQLQSTLSFKHYQLLTTILQRTKERAGYSPGFINGEGSAQATIPGAGVLNYRYSYQAASLALNTTPAGATTAQIGAFNFNLDGGPTGGKAAIRSDVGLREGERVVVGTAGLNDKALILVLTARLIK
jgi:hypothetical protein